MTYQHTFTVSWVGRFPLDMLRYDGCYPLTIEAAASVEYSVDQELRSRVSRSGTFASVRDTATWTPTFDRWRSFGAIVSNHATRKF